MRTTTPIARALRVAVVAVLVATAALATAPATGGADADDTVALFYDPNYVRTEGCSVGPPDSLCDGYALREWLRSLDVDLRDIDGITEGDFAGALDGANVLVFPTISATLGDDLSEGAEQAIADFVDGGGRVVFAGAVNVNLNPVSSINGIFGFSVDYVNTAACDDPCVESPEAAGTEFAGIGSYPDLFLTVGLDPATLPAGSIVPADDPTIALAPIAVMPYGDGSVVYVGWDFFDAEPAGSVDGGAWAEAMEAAITPITVDIAASATGPADGSDVECPVQVGPGSQPVRMSWEGSFASGGETFTGGGLLGPNEETAIFGYTDNPEGDTATVTITVESPFGEVVNGQCVITFTPTTPPTPPTPPPTAAPIAQPAPVRSARPSFTG